MLFQHSFSKNSDDFITNIVPFCSNIAYSHFQYTIMFENEHTLARSLHSWVYKKFSQHSYTSRMLNHTCQKWYSSNCVNYSTNFLISIIEIYYSLKANKLKDQRIDDHNRLHRVLNNQRIINFQNITNFLYIRTYRVNAWRNISV